MRVLERDVQVAVGVGVVPKGPAGQPQHPSHVTSGEWNLEAVRGRVRQPLHAIRPEVVVLALLSIANDWRSGRLELLDCVANGALVQRVQGGIGAIG
jgi:hypothetical protein